MEKTIISRESTSRGVLLTFCGDDHAEEMLFKDEEEFQMFRDYLNIMNVLGATSIDKLE